MHPTLSVFDAVTQFTLDVQQRRTFLSKCDSLQATKELLEAETNSIFVYFPIVVINFAIGLFDPKFVEGEQPERSG